MTKRVAIYTGSFDPFTNGHHEIVLRGLELFDEVIVLIAISPSKKPLFSMEERAEMIHELYKNEPRVSVDSFEGLVVDYARKKNVGFLLRGLRPTGDFDYEFHMAAMNHELQEKIDTVFLMTHKYHCVSSSAIREVLCHNGDVSKFVPQEIFHYLKKKRKICT